MAKLKNEIRDNYNSGILKYGHFSLDTHDLVDKLTMSKTKGIVNKIVKPILENSSEVFVYKEKGTDPDTNLFPEGFSLSRGKYVLSNTALLNGDYLEFWHGDDYSEKRGTVLIQMKNGQDVIKDIAPNCYDPSVYSSLGTILNKSCVSYARKNSSEEDIFVLVPGTGVGTIFIYSTPEVLREMLDISLSQATFTESYQNLYCD